MSAASCGCTATHAGVVRRVVLTGGPGAGKTAVLEVVRKQFCGHVVVLPEAAGIVYSGGFPRRSTGPARRAGQLAIYHVQDQLERLALGDGDPAMVLCDRGVLDGLAYWPGDGAEFFASTGTTHAAMLARYDAVIHLRTPTVTVGYNHQNPLRTETADEASEIDRRLLAAWAGHPRRLVVACETDFLVKLERTLAFLRDELPACCRPPASA